MPGSRFAFSLFHLGQRRDGVDPSSPEQTGRRQIGHRQWGWSYVVAFQRKRTPALGTKTPFPGFIEPTLATPVDRMPSGDR